MTKTIVRRLSPEEEELATKRAEFTALQTQLAERELYLANLRAELTGFEGRYLRSVGILYAELDDWNAKIAELLAEREQTHETRSAATQARTQAEDSRAVAHGITSQSSEFAASAELKSLYREVAKRVHPDLATDEADRNQRQRFMAEANEAYQRGDAESLRRILEQYEDSPDSVRGVGVAADLIRVLRQIKQVKDRLVEIETEIITLEQSDIAVLREKAYEASQQGRDLLEEMAERLQGRINSAKQKYEAEAARTQETR